MSDTVHLQNKLRQMQVFNLPHDVVCGKDKDSCKCVEKTLILVDELQGPEHGLRAGERMPRPIEKRLPASVTFLAGETLEVPAVYLKVHEVKLALFHGTLAKVDPPKVAAAPAAPQPEAAPAPAAAPVEAPAPAEAPTPQAEPAAALSGD